MEPNYNLYISYLCIPVTTVPEETGYKKTVFFWLTVSKGLAHHSKKVWRNSAWWKWCSHHRRAGCKRRQKPETAYNLQRRLSDALLQPTCSSSPSHCHLLEVPQLGRFYLPNSTNHYRIRVQNISLWESSRTQTIPCSIFFGNLLVRVRWSSKPSELWADNSPILYEDSWAPVVINGRQAIVCSFTYSFNSLCALHLPRTGKIEKKTQVLSLWA